MTRLGHLKHRGYDIAEDAAGIVSPISSYDPKSKKAKKPKIEYHTAQEIQEMHPKWIAHAR